MSLLLHPRRAAWFPLAVFILSSPFLAAQDWTPVPQITNGTLDLTAWNKTEQPVLRLDGIWRLLPPTAFGPDGPSDDAAQGAAFVEVPMNPRVTPFDHADELQGYRLNIQGSQDLEGQEIGLYTGFIPKAYSVLVDGREVFRHGVPSPDKDQHRSAAGNQLLTFSAPSAAFTLDILVSNPDFPRAGIHQAPFLGPAKELTHWVRIREMWDSIVIAGLVFLGLVLISSYVRIPQDARPGFLGLFSLLLGVRHGLGGSMSFHVLFPSLDFDSALLLGYACVYAAAACLGSYIESAGFIRLGKRVLSILWGAAGIGILLLLPGDLQLAFRIMVVFQVLLLFYIVAIVMQYFLAQEHPTGFRLFGFSFLTMALGGIVDFLELGELVGGPLITSLLILCGILMQSGHLVGRLSTAIGQARRLNQDLRSVLLLQDRIQSSLEQTVRSRSEALYSALEEARSANRAKTLFLANISHEVRTPLNGIVGFTDLLERSSDPEAAKLYVDLIRKESDRLLEMINQLLDISRIEAKKLVLNPYPVDLTARLLEFSRQIELSAVQKGLRFSMSLDPGLPGGVELDIQRFLQILHNLLSNSLKFTIEGGIYLDVRMENVDPANQTFDLEVQVSDTGIGIPEDKLSRIFESFEQASPGISRRFGGSGLGMSISRELVWAMGGSIQVESREGEGTRFIVRLPLRWSPEPLVPDLDALAPALEPRWAGNPNVLLVDDYELNIFMLNQYLSGLGLNLLTADSGDSALKLVRAWNPELILLDIHMPGIDGLETARILRNEGYRGRIVGLSASAFAQDRIQALDAGMDDFLSKPIRRRVLLDAVTTLFPPDSQVPEEPRSRRRQVLPAVLEDLARDIPVYLGLLGDFLRSATVLTGDMKTSRELGDWSSLKKAAHTLRGGASAVGAENLAAAAKALELAANHQNHEDAETALGRVLSAAQELFSAVDSLSS